MSYCELTESDGSSIQSWILSSTFFYHICGSLLLFKQQSAVCLYVAVAIAEQKLFDKNPTKVNDICKFEYAVHVPSSYIWIVGVLSVNTRYGISSLVVSPNCALVGGYNFVYLYRN